MLTVIFIILVALFCVQIATIIKLIQIVRQMNRVLGDVRSLFKYKGSGRERKILKLLQSKSCQQCRNRLSFIRISEVADGDNFYYRCKLKDAEVSLSDSCPQFEFDKPAN